MPRELTEEEIGAFRADLSRVAVDLFVDRGYAGVTIREIARRIGCSPMTPYRYFANKAEIFDAVRSECFARFGEWVDRELASHPADIGPIERLRALGRAYVAFALEEPRTYRMMFEVERLDSSDWLNERDLETWHLFRDATRAAVEAGVGGNGDPDVVAHLYWAGLHGIVALHHANRLELGKSVEDLVEPALTLFLGEEA